MSRFLLTTLIVLATSSLVHAQMPASHPPVPSSADARLGRVLGPPQQVVARPDASLPPGTIVVEVVDGEGNPRADAAVDVGAMVRGERERFNAMTDESGIARFDEMGIAEDRNYRVNAPREGALYSSTPFSLSPESGQRVRIQQLDATRDPRFTFFHVFRILIEQHEERMRVICQTELTNAGREAMVFEDGAISGALPDEATNFQFQRVMGDQRVEEVDGRIRLDGSLPPGTIRLNWVFEVPTHGSSDVDIPIELPLPVYTLQTIIAATPGLSVDIDGMPAPSRATAQGESCESNEQEPSCAFGAQERRAPGAGADQGIVLHLHGVPGPGPARWVALGLALLMLAFGVVLSFAKRDNGSSTARDLEAEKEAILRQVREIEEDFRIGEVGENFRQKRRDALVRELALVLKLMAEERPEAKPAASKKRAVAKADEEE